MRLQNVFYFKDNKYFIAENLKFDDILDRIYFDNYSFDDLKEYIFPALRQIINMKEFFDILFNSIKNYAEKIK